MPEDTHATSKGLTKNPLEESGRAVAENVDRLRNQQNLTFAALAKRLEEIGRPIPTLGLRKIIAHTRRVDVDDLVALAVALGVAPATLLMPDVETAKDEVVVTGHPDPVSAGRAWSWFARARPISKEISLTNFIANAWPSWRVRESLDELMEGAQTWEEQRLVDEHGSAYGSIRYYPVDLKDDPDGDD
jgi:transcriptional regulator with XRE-family HTH domain